jgi:hypothetical protein
MMGKTPEHDEPTMEGDTPLRSHGLVGGKSASITAAAE